MIITGTDFTGATAVTFGGTAATFAVNSATQITVTTPPHAMGRVQVQVTTPGGSSANTAADEYTYTTRYEQDSAGIVYSPSTSTSTVWAAFSTTGASRGSYRGSSRAGRT